MDSSIEQRVVLRRATVVAWVGSDLAFGLKSGYSGTVDVVHARCTRLQESQYGRVGRSEPLKYQDARTSSL